MDGKPVVVAKVLLEGVESDQSFVGTVRPLRKSVVGSAVDGRVETFPVKRGDRVAKGDVLAQLRTRTPSIEVEAAKAELRLRTAEWKEMTNGSREQEKLAAKAKAEEAKAATEYAKARYNRARELHDQRNALITADDMELSRSNWMRAFHTQAEAEASYALVMEGPRVEQIERAKAAMDSQQEEVNRLEDILKKYTIRAPFDGYVVAEHTEEGQWVSRGQLVAEVVELQEVEVEVFVPQQYITDVQLEAVAQVEVAGVTQQPLAGHVARIVPEADLRARTFPVMIRVRNPETQQGALLKSGMLAAVSLNVGKSQQAVLVPKDAIVLQGERKTVFIVDQPKNSGDTTTGTVRPAPVTLGRGFGAQIQVYGALKPGQFVVVEGNERLRPGDKVAFRAPR